MANNWLLLITDTEEERRDDTAALLEAGYTEECLLTTTADEAANFLQGRLADPRSKRPGLIVVDLNHAEGADRDRLRALMKSYKGHPEFRKIPLVMLMRPDKREDATEWYRAGVNAVAVRPNSHQQAVDFYRSVQAFWHGKVLLPEPEWTPRQL